MMTPKNLLMCILLVFSVAGTFLLLLVIVNNVNSYMWFVEILASENQRNLLKKLLSGYDTQVVPLSSTNSPVEVNVTVFLTQFMNIVRMHFIFNIHITL